MTRIIDPIEAIVAINPDAKAGVKEGDIDQITWNDGTAPIAKADIEVAYKEISLGGSMRYNSFMKNIDAIFTVIGSNDYTEPNRIPGLNDAREKFKDGDLIIDLRAGYQITKTARLGFIVNNLLNTEYMSRPANMMPPRTFAMQLALKI